MIPRWHERTISQIVSENKQANRNLPPKINPIKAAELSMLEHLTSESMLKDLSTNKIPKIWKGHLIQTQQQSTLFLLYSGKHSLKKLSGKHFKNKNRAEMYVKNEKLLLFSFKLSISIEMLEILKNYLKHSFQVFFLLKKHYCLKIHRSSKTEKGKCTYTQTSDYHNLCLKSYSCTKFSIYVKYQDDSKFLINT